MSFIPPNGVPISFSQETGRSFVRNYITGPEQFRQEDGSIKVAIYDDCVSPSDRTL